VIGEGLTEAGRREGLARRPTGDEREFPGLDSQRLTDFPWRYVFERKGANINLSRPVLVLEAQCVRAVAIHLHLDEHVPARGLEPEVEPARAGEKRDRGTCTCRLGLALAARGRLGVFSSK
jgi:hypothetical protein